jgi:hypothetical protein
VDREIFRFGWVKVLSMKSRMGGSSSTIIRLTGVVTPWPKIPFPHSATASANICLNRKR